MVVLFYLLRTTFLDWNVIVGHKKHTHTCEHIRRVKEKPDVEQERCPICAEEHFNFTCLHEFRCSFVNVKKMF